MKEFLGVLLWVRRRFLKEFKWFHGNGYSPRSPHLLAYSMNGVLNLLIVLFDSYFILFLGGYL
jgi:hypothetical protein